MAVSDYSTTAANNTTVGGVSQQENVTRIPQLNDTNRGVAAEIRGYANDQSKGFFVFGDGDGSPDITRTGSTTFTVNGSDQTAEYHVNRRIRAQGTLTGTIYGNITASTFASPNTTVTVQWDSGQMESETITIALGANFSSFLPLTIQGGSLISNAPHLFQDGTVSAPGMAFSGDVDTGIYRIGANELGLTAGGTLGLRTAVTAVVSELQHRFQAGSVSEPSVSFELDTNTGLYQSTTGQIDIAVDGSTKASINAGMWFLGATGGDQGNGTVNAVNVYRNARNIAERLDTLNSTAATAFTLDQSNAGGRIRTISANAVTITISSATSHLEGETYLITQAGNGIITLVGSGVTLNKPSDKSLSTRGRFSTIAISFVSGTDADVYGDLGVA
jgi:hypothetical protein